MIVSYDLGLKGEHRCFWEMVQQHRASVNMLVSIVNQEIDNFPGKKGHYLLLDIEHLVHSSRLNTAKYKCYDRAFPGYPVYLRRANINEAVGIVESYRSNLELWEESGRTGTRPKLAHSRRSMPVLYRDNMFRLVEEENGWSCRIKVCNKGKWEWRDFEFDKSDLKYITDHFDITEVNAPRLKKRMTRFELVMSFKTSGRITERENIAVAVDLGINTAAVCCSMDSTGKILDRKFIDFPVEKSRMVRVRNEKRHARHMSFCRPHRLQRWANNYNRTMAKSTAAAIIDYAKEMKADVVVVEDLHRAGKIKGRGNRQSLAWWCKIDIIDRIEAMSTQLGMRFRKVFAYNTSRLAFDGSGMVVRDSGNHSLCTFPNGKRYNSDLNAAYNIGARFFIRGIRARFRKFYGGDSELLKEIVPELVPETKCTLSTLLSLNEALKRFPEVDAIGGFPDGRSRKD